MLRRSNETQVSEDCGLDRVAGTESERHWNFMDKGSSGPIR